MLLKILNTLHVQPEQAVLIGDSTNDVRAAQAAGLQACAVGYGYGNREKVSALNPDFFCEHPEGIDGFIRKGIAVSWGTRDHLKPYPLPHYAFFTNPERKHRVQTRTLRAAPSTKARTF